MYFLIDRYCSDIDLKYMTPELGFLIENNPEFDLWKGVNFLNIDEETKNYLKQTIIDYFYYYNLNNPDENKFQHMFKSILNKNMPYYNNLYNLFLEKNNIKELLKNKEVSETYSSTGHSSKSKNENSTFSSNGDSSQDSNSTSEDSSINDSTYSDKIVDVKEGRDVNVSTSTSKISDVGDGVSIDLESPSLTGIGEDVNNSSIHKSDNKNTDKSGSNNTSLTETGSRISSIKNKNTRTEDLSKSVQDEGNNNKNYTKTISGYENLNKMDILSKYQETLINLTDIIIKDLSIVFMTIYNN